MRNLEKFEVTWKKDRRIILTDFYVRTWLTVGCRVLLMSCIKLIILTLLLHTQIARPKRHVKGCAAELEFNVFPLL